MSEPRAIRLLKELEDLIVVFGNEGARIKPKAGLEFIEAALKAERAEGAQDERLAMAMHLAQRGERRAG